jgi:hypothetical protein
MSVKRVGRVLCRLARVGLLMIGGIGPLAAVAQVAPLRYQLCEVRAPEANAAHRLETNYRYPPTSATRSFQDFAAYRCDAARAQSMAIFDAIETCPHEVTGCSADASGTCKDGPDDWLDYEFLAAAVWSDVFTHEAGWPQNSDVREHSALRGVTQWTRHRHWPWALPQQRYAYLGVGERPFTTAPGSYPKCYGTAYAVGLFNGVWNTVKSAEKGLDALLASDFIGPTHQNAPIKYQLFYNQTGCGSARVGCLEDLAEVYIQRSAELDGLLERRWEYFWEQVTGRADTPQSFTALLRSRVLNGAQALAQWLDSLASATLAKIISLAAQLLANPPTAADSARHIADLTANGQSGYRAVLVGHSQGNLFARAAYDGYLAHARQAGASAGQDTGYAAAKVVHVAPASAVLRGPHVLAEIDLVIEGLRRVSGSEVAVSTLSRDVMPPASGDLSGHRWVDTYLDPQRRARGDIRQLIVQAMDAL